MSCKRVEFGGTVAYVTMADEYKIRSGGQEFYFEFHPYCGPTLVTKTGGIAPFPRQSSPFWDALHFWLKQGKQVDAEGWCIYKAEMKLVHIIKHIGGRHYQILA